MKLSVIIPAYNEEATIESTLLGVLDYLATHEPDSELIIVDDGSTDRTREIVQTFASRDMVRLITHSTNQGKGAAVQSGMKTSQGERVLFMDADMSTHIQQHTLLHDALSQGADIAIGSRYVPGSQVAIPQSRIRIAMGRVANTLIRRLLLPGIYDTQCGFKLFTYEAAMTLSGLQTMKRWSFDMELLALAKKLEYRITEVPIIWNDSKVRRSRFRSIRDGGTTFRDMVHIGYNLMAKRYGDLDQSKKIR